MGVALTTGGGAECSEGAEFKPDEMIGESCKRHQTVVSLKYSGFPSDYKL